MNLRFDDLDDIDRKLIAMLQDNARTSVATLARRLSVARTTVLSRISRLERHEIITGYSARLGADASGKLIDAHVGIKVRPRTGQRVADGLASMPEVRLLCAVSGEYDYIAWVQAGSPARLDSLLDQIAQLEDVDRTTTSVILARKIDRTSRPA